MERGVTARTGKKVQTIERKPTTTTKQHKTGRPDVETRRKMHAEQWAEAHAANH